MAKTKGRSRAGRGKSAIRIPGLIKDPIDALEPAPAGTWPPFGGWPRVDGGESLPMATFPPYGTWPLHGIWPITKEYPKGFPARPKKKKGAAAPIWSVRSQWPKSVDRSAQLWEYALIEAHGPRNLGDALGVMGRNGWEAVNFAIEKENQYLLLLKRPANVQAPKKKP